MTLDAYIGSTFVNDIYAGDKLVNRIYKGNTLVYSKFKPNQIIIESSSPINRDIYLVPGYYELKLAGGGGGGSTATKHSIGASGGSGAEFTGVLYLTQGTYNVIVGGGGYGTGGSGGYVAGNGSPSYFSNLVIAGGGGGGYTDTHGGYRGYITFNITPYQIETSSNGYDGYGAYGSGTTSRTAMPNSQYFPDGIGQGGGGGVPNWGGGQWGGNGYILLRYLGG